MEWYGLTPNLAAEWTLQFGLGAEESLVRGEMIEA